MDKNIKQPIERFKPYAVYAGPVVMGESENGEWVRYEDHIKAIEALQQPSVEDDVDPKLWKVSHNGKSITADKLVTAMGLARHLRTEEEERIANENLMRAIDEELSEQTPTWECAARSDPQDCDWPMCGCDPHADKVIAALQESGALASSGELPSEEDEKLIEILRGFSTAYPEEVFRPIDAETIEAIHSTYPGVIDRISAAMGRHCAKFMAQAADRIAALSSAAGQQTTPDGWQLVKSSAIHCANHMTVLAGHLFNEMDSYEKAEDLNDEEMMSYTKENISEYISGIRNEIYEYRKRMVAAPTPEGSGNE